jgi:hypothetical protein
MAGDWSCWDVIFVPLPRKHHPKTPGSAGEPDDDHQPHDHEVKKDKKAKRSETPNGLERPFTAESVNTSALHGLPQDFREAALENAAEALRRSESERLRLSVALISGLPREFGELQALIRGLTDQLTITGEPANPVNQSLRDHILELESQLLITQAALELHQDMIHQMLASRRWRIGAWFGGSSNSSAEG